MNRTWLSKAALGSASVLLAAGLTACGSSEPETALAADWDSVVEAAKKEGSVTVYTSQKIEPVEKMAADFEAKYGIKVTVMRDIDANIIPKVDAEVRSGKPAVDVLINATESAQAKYSADGVFVKPISPVFDELDIMKDDNYFDLVATSTTFAWNTDAYKGPLTSYEDLLDPALKGKIGVPEPSVAAFVDLYTYLEDLYGEEFTEKLGAQDPQIYPGAAAATQALMSGEIWATLHAEPMFAEKEAGAPVDWNFVDKVWSAFFYAGIMADSPHPNAAQLLVDYMLSIDGQSAIALNAYSIRPDVPTALGTTEGIHRMDPGAITPQAVTDYQAKWNKYFR